MSQSAGMNSECAGPVEQPASVSVIVPAYNATGTLGRCLDSVFAQTYPAILEVIVIDDGSRDDPGAWLAEHYPQVKCVRQENGGSGAARNHGVELAEGHFIAFLDADDVWLPDKLARQMAVFARQPQLGLLLTRFIRVFPSGRRLLPPPNPAAEVVPLTLSLWLSRRHRARLGVYASASSWVMRRDLFVAFGGFERGLAIIEDHDLVMRLLAQGQQVAALTEPLFLYYISATSVSHQPNCAGHLACGYHVLNRWATVPLENSDLSEPQRRALVLGELRVRATLLARSGCLPAALELLAATRSLTRTSGERLALAAYAWPIRLGALLGGDVWSPLAALHAFARRVSWRLRTRR